MFDQSTLFTRGANSSNVRHSFFQMDVAIGSDMGEFWLFGGTGNFNNIGQTAVRMDNILYGIKDENYPYFKHLNGVTIPKESEGEFLSAAHSGAEAARNIDNANDCTPVTGEDTDNCPITAQFAWRIHLDTIDLIPPRETTDDGVPRTNHRFRKVSAAPTVFKGNVYFPIYEPTTTANACKTGKAILKAYDTKCGNSLLNVNIGTGVLSKVVKQGDNLYIGIAGEADKNISGFSSKDNLITGKSKAVDTGNEVQLEKWIENY